MPGVCRPSIRAVLTAAVLLSGCGGSRQTTPAPPTAPSASNPAPADPVPAPPASPAACAYTLGADPDDFARDGQNGRLTIGTGAGCKWTIAGDAPWLSVEGPRQGEGPATLKVYASSNDGLQERRATLAVADASVAVTQPGQGDCTFQVSPTVVTIPRSRWTGDVEVATDRGCRWTAAAAADMPWLRLRSAGASGPGTITYDADFNPEAGYAVTRAAVIAVRWSAPTAGQNVRLTQWGACNIAFSQPGNSGFASDTVNVGAAGGTFHYFVLTDPFQGCAWTVEADGTWLSIDFPKRHAVQGGDGDLRFTVPANTATSSRRAVITVGDKPLTILQQGR